MKRVDEDDLQNVMQHTLSLWDDLKGKSIFITGATGFFGKWFLETFLYINHTLQLNATVCALSRNPDKFLKDFPFYNNEPSIRFIKGDIQNFEYPEEQFNYIIHAATDADVQLNNEKPLLMLDTIVTGTKHILGFAKLQKKLEAFLLTSSGAVYGKQPSEVTHTKETDSFFIDINHPSSAYAEGKRMSELYCAIYHKEFGLPIKIARCFAFIGPYLPLDKHFAIGNFICDALNGKEIIIKGDGTPFRSYLYASDLATALWTILFRGKVNEVYNIGSDIPIDIRHVAEEVVKAFNNKVGYRIMSTKTGDPILRYVPNIDKAKFELGLIQDTDFTKSINKTINFYSPKNSL